MSATFTLSPSVEIDFELCLFCGQVFRFIRTLNGYSGFDGPHSFELVRGAEDWQITGDRDAFERLFRLDLPIESLHQDLIRCGPEMEAIIGASPGLRTMRPSDAAETFFCFLCTSNNNIARITQMISKLSEYGSGGHFPSAEAIAAIGEARLRELGFGYRALGIAEAAGRLAREPGLLGELSKAPYEEAFAELLTFRGVGPKLADCIALYSLGHTEAVPVDTHMWQAYCRHYGDPGVPLTDRRMREVGDFMRGRFGGLAGFAQHYLFVENLRRKRA